MFSRWWEIGTKHWVSLTVWINFTLHPRSAECVQSVVSVVTTGCQAAGIRWPCLGGWWWPGCDGGQRSHISAAGCRGAADNYRHLTYLQPWETRALGPWLLPGAWLVLSILNIIHAFCVKLLLFSQHSSGTTWQTTCILHPNVSFWVYLLWPNCWAMSRVRMACIHRLILAPSWYIATCNIKHTTFNHNHYLPLIIEEYVCFGCRQRCFYSFWF